jgi:hypothetical protein
MKIGSLGIKGILKVLFNPMSWTVLRENEGRMREECLQHAQEYMVFNCYWVIPNQRSAGI